MTVQLTSLECPKCGKQTLIQRKTDLYVCLGCDFKKDFAAPPPKKPAIDPKIFPWLGILVLTLLIFNRTQPKLANSNPRPRLIPTVQNPTR